MKLHFDFHGYPAEDWQRRFVIFDQTGSTCRVVCHPIMSTGAMSPLHETRVSASHGCNNMEENPAINSASASVPKLLGVNSKGKEVKLHHLNNRESALGRSLEKCHWKLLEDVHEDESGSQHSCASHPWRERSEDIDALLSSDEGLSTGRSPNMDENINVERTSGLANGELVSKLDRSEDKDEEVNSKPSAGNPLHNQFLGKSVKCSKAQSKRKIVGFYNKKHKSPQGRSSFKSRLRRENISQNPDLLKEGLCLNSQLILEQAMKLAKRLYER